MQIAALFMWCQDVQARLQFNHVKVENAAAAGGFVVVAKVKVRCRHWPPDEWVEGDNFAEAIATAYQLNEAKSATSPPV